MNIKDHAEHVRKYGATREAMNKANEIFIQDDGRYEDFLSHPIVAGFKQARMIKEAVRIAKS